MAATTTAQPAKPVLLTGASGALGRKLSQAMGTLGWPLRLTDIAPFPDALPAGATFTQADLVDLAAIRDLAKGCGTIVHFGGTAVDKPFDEVIGPNIRGLYNIYEAAKAEGARVVFASSNHAVGFHERTTVLDDDSAFRPDTFYGLSKAYAELMGGLYYDKHGIESVFIRIGSCFPEPVDARMLATWLSYDDLARAVIAAVLAEKTDLCVLWGASKNARMTWWRGDGRAKIGWEPQDSADPFTERLKDKASGDPVAERYQGGGYAAAGYSRK
jgi:uronate dehydrogenase